MPRIKGQTMGVRWVIARSDGRGGLRIPVKNPKDFAFEALDIGGRSVSITTDGRANIPKKIMEEHGVRLPDGRYALAVDVGYRYTENSLRVGAYINKDLLPPADVKTGDTFSYRNIDIDNEVINPTTDGTEYYTAGD